MRSQSAVIFLLLGASNAVTLDKRTYSYVQQSSQIRLLNGQKDWGDVAQTSNAGDYSQETMSAVQDQNVHAEFAESMSVAQFEAKQAVQDKKDQLEKQKQMAEIKKKHDLQEQENNYQSLETMQKDLKNAKEAKKVEDIKKMDAPVFDHRASSLIQPAAGSVLVQQEKAKVQLLTEAGKKKEQEIKEIDQDLCQDDQQKVKDEINEKYKGQILSTEQVQPKQEKPQTKKQEPQPKKEEKQIKTEEPKKVADKKIADILATTKDEEEIKAKIAAIDDQVKNHPVSHGQVTHEDLKIEDKSSGEIDLSMSQTDVDLHLKSMTTSQMQSYNDMSENIKKFSKTLEASLYDKALEQRQSLADQGLPSTDIPMLHVETVELFEKGFAFSQISKQDFSIEQLNELQAAEDNLNSNLGNHNLVSKLVETGHKVAEALKSHYDNNWQSPLES